MSTRCVCMAASLLALGVFAQPVVAEDHFLTIGGGYAPTGNQVSLEKNVLFFQQLLVEQYPEGASHDIFFSDGDNPHRDLQFQDPDFKLPLVNELLARVFRTEKYLKYQYRNHQIPSVRGGTNRENLERWFDEVGRKLQADDRLFVYVTAHGGRSTDKKQPMNTTLYFWNSQKLQMKDLVAQLDRIPAEVPVVLVMVQCYSGGFANLVFKDGDADQGYTSANRCGFFATVHSRPAAGCTPEINEENYREYSSYFWAAIGGRSRTGTPVVSCDYDADGSVSFAEAHAYALLESHTIDISVKTSDVFLRKYSKLRDAQPKADKPSPEAGPPANGDDSDSDSDQNSDGQALCSADTPFEELLPLATPAQRAVLEGLSSQLQLAEGQRATAAKNMAQQLAGEKKKLDDERRRKASAYGGVCKQIQRALVNRWPELANRWHPRVSQMLAEQADEVVQLVQSHAAYSKFQSLANELDDLSNRARELDEKWAKCQRLRRELENVALAANLPKVASAEVQQRYQLLRSAEGGTFGPAAATAAPSTAAND